jgi:hypothetical protein
MSSQGLQPSPDCDVVAPTECPDVVPTWTQLEPLFNERCVTCHYGAEGGPWPLGGHEHIVHWQVQIRDVVLGCIMPPADAEVTLSTAERELILQWLLCGAP